MTGPGQEPAASGDEDRTQQDAAPARMAAPGPPRETVKDLEPEEDKSANIRAGKAAVKKGVRRAEELP